MQHIEYTDSDFRFLQRLAKSVAGINLSDSKKDMIYARLARYLYKQKIPDFKTYCRMLEENPDETLPFFIDSVSTNLTGFYREKHHFDFLRDTVIPEYAAKRQLNIWSAGCSEGKEPYTIAFVLHDHIPNIDSWKINILATDINTQMLHMGEVGIYTYDDISQFLSPEQLKKYCHRGKGEKEGLCKIKSHLKDMITWQRLNLIQNWNLDNQQDIIFCRNVLIYFDQPTQEMIITNFARQLKPGGYLILGHSESLPSSMKKLKPLMNTVYKYE